MKGHEAIKAAAVAQLYGVDGMALLSSQDPVEVMVMQALVEATSEYRAEFDQSRANLHANSFGQVLVQVLKKMFRK